MIEIFSKAEIAALLRRVNPSLDEASSKRMVQYWTDEHVLLSREPSVSAGQRRTYDGVNAAIALVAAQLHRMGAGVLALHQLALDIRTPAFPGGAGVLQQHIEVAFRRGTYGKTDAYLWAGYTPLDEPGAGVFQISLGQFTEIPDDLRDQTIVVVLNLTAALAPLRDLLK